MKNISILSIEFQDKSDKISKYNCYLCHAVSCCLTMLLPCCFPAEEHTGRSWISVYLFGDMPFDVIDGRAAYSSEHANTGKRDRHSRENTQMNSSGLAPVMDAMTGTSFTLLI